MSYSNVGVNTNTPVQSIYTYQVSLVWLRFRETRFRDPLLNTSTLPNSRGFELLSQNLLAVYPKPLVEDSGIHLSEINGVLQVAEAVIGQAGMFSDRAGFDLGADQEHRGGGAVVGSLAAVFIRPAAELRERHHHDAVLVPARGHVLIKSRHRIRQLTKQIRMG